MFYICDAIIWAWEWKKSDFLLSHFLVIFSKSCVLWTFLWKQIANCHFQFWTLWSTTAEGKLLLFFVKVNVCLMRSGLEKVVETFLWVKWLHKVQAMNHNVTVCEFWRMTLREKYIGNINECTHIPSFFVLL